MSDRLVVSNRMQMKLHFGIRVGPGLEIMRNRHALCAILQALFACEEFRIKIILIGHIDGMPPLYSNIADLFKHMVISKQAFLIPSGILEILWPQEFDENHLIGVLNAMLIFIRVTFPDQWNLTNLPTDTFLGEFTYKCNTGCVKVNTTVNSMWYAMINITGQSLQEEIDKQFINPYLYHFSNGCPECGGHVECQWKKPNVLIVILSTLITIDDMDGILELQEDLYSPFACICFDSVLNIYTCYAKLDRMWCCYAGRDAKEIAVLTQLTNVYLLFYKKDGSNSIYSTFIEKIDSEGVIPQLILPENVNQLELSELKPRLKSKKYTERDILKTLLSIESLLFNTGLVNVEGICFMNAVLQALFYCRVFRKYILESDHQLGAYHTLLRNLFTAMRARNRNDINEWHKQLWILYKPITEARKNNNSYLFHTDIDRLLHEEFLELIVSRGVTPYAQQTHRFELTNKRNYANVVMGREDMASADAWMRSMIEHDFSYVRNMFYSQRMVSKRCRSGHKTYLTFHHYGIVVIHNTFLNNQFVSLQAFIDRYKSAQPLDANIRCQTCTNTELNGMFEYNAYHISRASNILVVMFEALDANNQYRKMRLTVDEYLVVCGNKYRSVAVQLRKESKPNHTYTIARCDDNQWWELNDERVRRFQWKIMPQNLHFADNVCINIAYYEKVSRYSEIRINRNRMSLETTKSLDEIGMSDMHINIHTERKELSLKASKVVLRFSGDYNAKTSYLNSVLQCLYHCFEFRKYIIFDQISVENTTHYLLKLVFLNLSCTDYSSADTKLFCNEFSKYHRQFAKTAIEFDPNMFLRAVIKDLLIENTEHYKEYANTFVDQWISRRQTLSYIVNENMVNLFAVINRQEMYCHSGNHYNVSYRHRYIVELDSRSHSESIQSLFNAYCNLYMSGHKTIQCYYCKCNAVQSKSLYRMPNILVMRLKMTLDASSTRVDHNIEINHDIYVSDEQLSLRACICCDGWTDDAFHYYCHALCDDGFYSFNDRSMHAKPGKQLRLPNVLRNCYLLFYEKL